MKSIKPALKPLHNVSETNTTHQHLLIIKNGCDIFSQGDVGLEKYLIVRGEIRVLVGLGGIQKEVCILSQGMKFGEIAQLSPSSKRTATCRAKGEVHLECIKIIPPTINTFNNLDVHLVAASDEDTPKELEFDSGTRIMEQNQGNCDDDDNSFYVIVEGIIDVFIDNVQKTTLVEGEIICRTDADLVARCHVKLLKIKEKLLTQENSGVVGLLKQRKNQVFSEKPLTWQSSPTLTGISKGKRSKCDSSTTLPKLDLHVTTTTRMNKQEALIALESIASNFIYEHAGQSIERKDMTNSTKRRVSRIAH